MTSVGLIYCFLYSTAFLNEKNELEAQVSKLTEIVNTYKANERRYLELACQKADAQRQINFIQHLQKQQKGEPEQVFRYTNF